MHEPAHCRINPGLLWEMLAAFCLLLAILVFLRFDIINIMYVSVVLLFGTLFANAVSW